MKEHEGGGGRGGREESEVADGEGVGVAGTMQASSRYVYLLHA